VRKVAELTRHILGKPGVERLAVIMNVVNNTRVDLVARGVIKGCLETGREPSQAVAVFRIPGAWEEEGFRLLRHYGIDPLGREVSIDEAARRAVRWA
jgi:succinyl-CoA synthetase beta subunit/citryl-CoA synthetase large subunit